MKTPNEIIDAADEWADAYWHGTLSPHGDHGPVLALIDLARRQQAELEQNLRDRMLKNEDA